MKNNLSTLKFVSLAAFTLLTFGARLEAQIYEYDWIGGESGFSGKIFFDAASSASAPHGGTVADVLGGSYLTTPIGNYPIFDSAFSSQYGSAMSWDKNRIITADLFFQPTAPIYAPYFGQPSDAETLVGTYGVTSGIQIIVKNLDVGGFYTHNPDNDYSGQWLAVPVPEPATCMLAAIEFTALIMLLSRSGDLDEITRP